MKAIIFGISGQDGFYLTKILAKNGIEIVGVSRNDQTHVIGDVANFSFIEQLIKDHQPAYIFHLAANSSTRHALLFENYDAITTGTINILEAVYRHSKNCKVFISGSGLQFVNNGSPISETDEFEARDAYSMARIQSVYAARYFRSLGIKTYVGYFFHHDSPLRNEHHLNMQIVKTALKIKTGAAEKLAIGDTQVIKEFNHAYDMMAAIWCLIRQESVFEAVIGSGIGYKIADWIQICFDALAIDDKVEVISGYKPEFSALVSNPATIRSLGWEPMYDIYYLANDMIANG